MSLLWTSLRYTRAGTPPSTVSSVDPPAENDRISEGLRGTDAGSNISPASEETEWILHRWHRREFAPGPF